MTRKLLVIGLDGYESSIGERLMREGRLPTLCELTKRSAQVHLDHGSAKRTGLAWEHFSSGLAPEAANRWSAVWFNPVDYRCVQIGTELDPFPTALSLKTVVFDPPYFDLDRSRSVQGIVGWGAHDPGTPLRTNPAGLLGEIRKQFGDYPATRWIYGITWPSEEQTKKMGSALVDAVHVRADAARWLLTKRLPDWALGIVVVSELHSASEAFWHGVDQHHPLYRLPSAALARVGLEETYQAVDTLVGTLASSCSDAAVLVFSMHGMGPNESDVASMALLSEFMFRRHFKRPLMVVPDTAHREKSGVPELDEGQTWTDHLRRYFPQPRADSSISRPRIMQRMRGLVPDPVKSLLRTATGRASRPMSSSLRWMPADWYSKFWPQMDAFAIPSFYDGQIRINLVGREANGRIQLHHYENVCARIEDDLCACVDPSTGERVVGEVIRNRRSDPLRMGPTEADLIVVWNGAQLAFEHPVYGMIGPCPYRRTGGHTGHHGVAWFSDAETTPGFYGSRSAFDVVPTISHYLSGVTRQTLSGESFLPLILGSEPRTRATRAQ